MKRTLAILAALLIAAGASAQESGNLRIGLGGYPLIESIMTNGFGCNCALWSGPEDLESIYRDFNGNSYSTGAISAEYAWDVKKWFTCSLSAATNVFWTKGENLLVEWKFITIYSEGIRAAILMITRLITLITGTFVLLTYTTSPMALTDAIERLTSPLKKLGVPTHEFAMMMTIALRFIPTLIDEIDRIMSAQKARGADFESGNLLKRIKALFPIFIPLIISSFKRAFELADAMSCRCYVGGKGRTRMRKMQFTYRDAVALVITVVICGAIIFMNFMFEALI